MAYLNCPRCRLAIGITRGDPMSDCPRCLGPSGVPMPMYVSDSPVERWSGWLGFVKPATS